MPSLRGWLFVAVCVLWAGGATAATLTSDNFERSVSNTVGNGWSELESGSSDVAIINVGAPHNGVLQLRDELSGSPDAAAAAGFFSTVGFTNIRVSFDWRTSGAEGNDTLFFSYITTGTLNQSLMQNEGAWTTVPVGGFSTNDNNWHSVVNQALGAAAANTTIAVMFWTTVNNGNDAFLIDNFVLSGDPNPLPAAAMLMGSVLFGAGGLGVWRRRRRSATA